MELILASSSPYRRILLSRLQIPFRCDAPATDESPVPGEQPQALALRLARSKAHAVAERNAGALVLGSDQVASIDGSLIGKPGNHAAAASQLQASSGRSVDFYTAVALVGVNCDYSLVEKFTVHFRKLSAREIDIYLHKETPYDCAGSFKCEGLGVALFSRLEGDDPTALEGLPLIATCRLLRQAGFDVLGDA
ncbi:Maf family protein [Pseudohalioglobus lutimaris]|uniref:7-methyl-GTP pyrophosphatase n=1 Tax=Pseudohalioglobus lutimaris TaxID=1737061 RepID=A0A2N5X384_9GAMM|nr:Maf family nucleotide pyrophosphatase [Pseudohalioglobus lutimaris]PLW68920.1 septum formation inhibitor Maf [Pseudohalioglobus lutimaris]